MLNAKREQARERPSPDLTPSGTQTPAIPVAYPILQLQHTIGNRAVQRLLHDGRTDPLSHTQAPAVQAAGPRDQGPGLGSNPEERRAGERLEQGGSAEGEARQHYNPLQADLQAGTLNSAGRSSEEYRRALQEWPSDQQIWPYLRSRQARIEFIRYLLETDPTNCRPYSESMPGAEPGCEEFAHSRETFQNVCQGFATQLHLRLRDRPGPPDAAQIERLRTQARIYYEAVDVKFRIPIQIATVPGHAFNSILVGDNPASIDSYLFVEPQTDSLFEPSSAEFGENFRVGALTISDLAEYNERGQYIEATRQTFVREPSGRAVAADLDEAQRMSVIRIYNAIFIADDGPDTWRGTIEARGTTYEEHVRSETSGISNDHLLLAARYAIGRRFRRSLGGSQEELTIDAFLTLVNRESLRERLVAQQESLARGTPEGESAFGSETGR